MTSTTEINDRVDVLAKFSRGQLVPTLLRWRGRRYWIQKLNLHHTQREGSDTLHHFAVTTEVGDCGLMYSQENLTWTLTEAYFDG